MRSAPTAVAWGPAVPRAAQSSAYQDVAYCRSRQGYPLTFRKQFRQVGVVKPGITCLCQSDYLLSCCLKNTVGWLTTPITVSQRYDTLFTIGR